MHVNFFYTTRVKVLKKNPCKCTNYTHRIYNYIHLNTQYLFKLENVDDYTCLQAHVSIEELIQPNTIIKGVTIATTNLVANVLPNGVGKLMKKIM